VIVARSATEAIEIAGQSSINLLITDVIMPDMNGQDLASSIVRLQPCVRVLYMSGFASEVLSQRGIDRSDLGFLQKPFSPGELANRVRDLLAG
jgi:two-component system cell cycle sensor histidine kinase/response regulator CckA